MNLELDLDQLKQILAEHKNILAAGFIDSVHGPIIKAKIVGTYIGEMLEIHNHPHPQKRLQAKVVGFESDVSILSPLGTTDKIVPGCKVTSISQTQSILGCYNLLGSVVNAKGQIIDSVKPCKKLKNKIKKKIIKPEGKAPDPLKRVKISKHLETGIKAIDGFCTLAFGQRIAIFAEPGVGKTTLLGGIIKHNQCAVNVIALVGERGREVQEFVHENLSSECRQKTIIVASTSDESAVSRIQASLLATGIAEFFRDNGLDVLLVIDSLTRLFRAYREVGLSAGEIPVRRGYPPSAYEKMPQLIERAGSTKLGSITAIYSVLLSGELDEDPMVEEVKGLTDGHIVLRKQLAENGQYPALSVSESLSRLQGHVLDQETLLAVNTIRKFKAEFDNTKDILMLADGQRSMLEKSILIDSLLTKLIIQDIQCKISFEETQKELFVLAKIIEAELSVS